MRLPLLPTFALLAACALTHGADYRLSFEENFSGDKLNSEVWNVSSGSHQRGTYTDQALDLKDGVLTITTWTDKGTCFTGGIATKSGNFVAFRHGKIEGRLRFNISPGISTSFGSFTDQEFPQQTPVLINLVEAFAGDKGAYMTAVYWTVPSNPNEHKQTKQKVVGPEGVSWRTYGVEWDDAGYRFTLDGKIVATDDKSMRCDTPRGLMLRSVAFGKASPANGGYGPKNKSKNVYEIDWVKAWERTSAAK